ncbi:MAG TPA: Wzz/FepE/Etk N-terminal domain-containing protein [Anaerolineae bacterium]
MELNDYLRILRQRGWLIILLALLTAAAAYGFSRMQPEIYRSDLRLWVNPARLDFGQTQAVKELLGGYEAWLQSSLRAKAVIDELQLDMMPEALLGDVAFASDSLRRTVQISVKNTDPSLANDIATAWGTLLIQEQQKQNDQNRQEDRITIEFQDTPKVSLHSPQTKINTAAGAVFGALLGVIVVFFLEWIESGVLRRTEDVERYLEIPVIGTIPTQ